MTIGYAERDGPAGVDRDGDSSFELRHKVDEVNGFSLFLSNGFAASGAGEARYESRLSLSWSRSLTERMRFTLATEGVNVDDRDYIEVVAGGSYDFSRELKLAANYRYRTQQSDTIDADSGSVLFSLSYSPVSRWSHAL